MNEDQNALAEKRVGFRRTRWVLALVAAVLILVVLVHLIKRKPAPKGAPPQAVKVAQATIGDMQQTLTELGTVTPTSTVS
jgi:multidrug efflux system membrane fusion protein